MLKNKHIGLVAGLLDTPLKGADRRNRDQAVESFRSGMEKMETERIKLIEEHAEKDAKGKSKVKDGRYIIKDQDKFDKEYSSYLDEEITELKDRPYKWMKKFLQNVGETKEMGVQDSKNYEEMKKDL